MRKDDVKIGDKILICDESNYKDYHEKNWNLVLREKYVRRFSKCKVYVLLSNKKKSLKYAMWEVIEDTRLIEILKKAKRK